MSSLFERYGDGAAEQGRPGRETRAMASRDDLLKRVRIVALGPDEIRIRDPIGGSTEVWKPISVGAKSWVRVEVLP